MNLKQESRKEFTKAEIEVIRFEKDDVIATSMQSGTVNPPGGPTGEDDF